MTKVLYSTDDIVSEFLVASYLLGFDDQKINRTIEEIRNEWFQLIVKKVCNRRVYICEWVEDWILISDKWVLDPDRFITSIAREYMRG